MLDAEDILNGLVRGALGGPEEVAGGATGRAVRGSGLINARTLLAAAGVAWGLYETWQGQRAGPTAAAPPTGAPPMPAATPPPLPAAGGRRAAPPRAACPLPSSSCCAS